MSYKKIFLVLGALLLLLAALTVYLNHVVFPRLIKKFAIEQLEKNLKRKVEIRTMHFNWFKGFVIDDIKIYEKHSPLVFAKATQISFGLVIIPGFKHYQLTIPFIHVDAPFIHLIYSKEGIWNFDDLQNSPVAAEKIQTSSGPQITWGGLTMANGQCLLEDNASAHVWSELFDHINLKFALSLHGTDWDFSADIPKKNSLIKMLIGFQPISQNTHAHIDLKNINIATYLSLFKIPIIQINSGMIKSLAMEIHHTQDQTTAEGGALMTNIDIDNQGQNFKGTIAIHALNAQYDKGRIKAHGQLTLSDMMVQTPQFSGQGSLVAKIDRFEWGPGDGLHVTSNMMIRNLFIHHLHQSLKADLTINSLELQALDENHVLFKGDLRANNFVGQQETQTLTSTKIHLGQLAMEVTNQKDLTLTTDLSLEQAALIVGNTLSASGSLKADRLEVKSNDKFLDLSTSLSTSQAHLVLEEQTLDANPHLKLHIKLPFKKGLEPTYQGSVVFSDATISGLKDLPPLHDVALDADFKTDKATINALSFNIFDTNIQAQGTVIHFKHPWLDIDLQSPEFNLADIKNIAPSLIAPYKLDIKGTGKLQAIFDGLLEDPLTGQIQAKLSLNHASVLCRQYHKKIEDISGMIEATRETLAWHDLEANFWGKQYTTQGAINNFKHPKIRATLNGDNLQLQIQGSKNKDNLFINHLTGRLFNVDLDAKGVVTLREDQPPYFNLSTQASVNLEDLNHVLPDAQKKKLLGFSPVGYVKMRADLKGAGLDWKNYHLNAAINSPSLVLMGYTFNDIKINTHQQSGKTMDVMIDGRFYDGSVHAVASLNLAGDAIPYTLALNIEAIDLHKLKIDSPLKMEEINGKFYLTAIADGTIADFKNNLHATGSVSIKEGYLGQFSLFKGLLSVLNEALRLGQIMITDVNGNFTVSHQKITTDDLRLQGPTLVLLTKGWVDFDQICNLNVVVDLSSGIVPPIAHDILGSIYIRIYDKVSHPKFKRKISMPEVFNTLLKNFL